MDEQRDEPTRAVSRRAVIKGLAGGALATAGVVAAAASASADTNRNRNRNTNRNTQKTNVNATGIEITFPGLPFLG